MTSDKHPAYPPNMMNGRQHTGAFVIQFCAETDMDAGRCEGRAEHVTSGQTVHFCSLSNLLAFLDRVLKETRAANQQEQI